jgi:hypothetical protein
MISPSPGGWLVKVAKVWWLSAATGAGLGLLFRLTYAIPPLSRSGEYLTIAYLVVAPAAMGWIAVRQYLRHRPIESVRWYEWLFLPWMSVVIMLVFAMLTLLEGAICILMASPILLVFSMIGGLLARLLWNAVSERPATNLSVAALPLAVLLIEMHIPYAAQIRTVHTEILVRAPADVVWTNIKCVRAIDARELPGSWVNRIGFPKPVEATLSHDGVGGVRQASFTGGLVFTETVNEWRPEQDLRFSIRANTDQIPAATLDEHVTIGGAYFDVLEGEYRLEPRSDGVLLHLTSRERLSTHVNAYAGAWTDGVMRGIQKQILEVIRARCEAGTATALAVQ